MSMVYDMRDADSKHDYSVQDAEMQTAPAQSSRLLPLKRFMDVDGLVTAHERVNDFFNDNLIGAN
jgi:hypothetical protein